MVTKSLERAMQELSKLPEDEQDAYAQRILNDLMLKNVPHEEVEITPTLRAMIDKARQNIRDGLTEPLDPDKL